jgi:hypothetical protein
VFGFRLGEPRTGVRGWLLSVARAFQPEICPSAIDRRTGAGEFAGSLAHAKPRREGAKGQWRFFEYEYEYRPPGRTEYEYEGRPL